MTLQKARWLVVGASGLLGQSLVEYVASSGRAVTGVRRAHAVSGVSVDEVVADLSTAAGMEQVAAIEADVVIYAAGLTSVDECERHEDAANHLNADVPAALARATARKNGRFVYISTDHMWAGDRAFVDEDAEPAPLNAYARSKWAGERKCREVNPDTLVARTNFFGPGTVWRQSFSDWIATSLKERGSVNGFEDVHFTPIATALLCPLLARLAESDQTGIWHLAGGERLSKYEFARRLAGRLGYGPERVVPIRLADAALAATRPRDMSLATAKAASWFGHPMPNCDDSLSSLFPHV